METRTVIRKDQKSKDKFSNVSSVVHSSSIKANTKNYEEEDSISMIKNENKAKDNDEYS